jgi:hypothetical protein
MNQLYLAPSPLKPDCTAIWCRSRVQHGIVSSTTDDLTFYPDMSRQQAEECLKAMVAPDANLVCGVCGVLYREHKVVAEPVESARTARVHPALVKITFTSARS